MAQRIRIRDLLEYADLDVLRELADHLLDAGHSRNVVVDDVAAAIDAAVPFDLIVPGAVGAILESLDGPLLRIVARLIVDGVAKVRARRNEKRLQPA
jgi:hypothetical protein